MAPFRKKAATRLAEARTAQADMVKRIAEVDAARAKAILDEDDAAARKLDAELEELRRDARIGADRVRLLEAQAQEEEQAAVLQRRKAFRGPSKSGFNAPDSQHSGHVSGALRVRQHTDLDNCLLSSA
jgi:hypothetical protein